MIPRLFTSHLFAFAAISCIAIVANQQMRVYAQEAPSTAQPTTSQKLCSFDPVENLLPPLPSQSNSVLSYLGQEGFTNTQDQAWVCYVNDSKKEGRYYTLFKVQERNGKLIGSSFLDNGSLITGQDDRSLDFFMTLIERHTNTTPETRQSIRRYLEAFITLVEEGKIKPSRRGFLFDQPNGALIMYHPLTTGELKGTAITINIQAPKNLSSRTPDSGLSNARSEALKPNQ